MTTNQASFTALRKAFLAALRQALDDRPCVVALEPHGFRQGRTLYWRTPGRLQFGTVSVMASDDQWLFPRLWLNHHCGLLPLAISRRLGFRHPGMRPSEYGNSGGVPGASYHLELTVLRNELLQCAPFLASLIRARESDAPDRPLPDSPFELTEEWASGRNICHYAWSRAALRAYAQRALQPARKEPGA